MRISGDILGYQDIKECQGISQDVMGYEGISGDIRDIRGYQKMTGDIGISVISGDVSK